MASKKTTRRALFSSIMALLLCCSMLVGTTFAWFTDSVTSTGNIIKSGTLDVEMTWADTFDGEWKDASTGAIFNYQLWEPGFTQTKYVKIANVGTLDFKYQLNIVPNFTPETGADLADVIEVYLVPTTGAIADRNVINTTNGTILSELIKDNDGAAHGQLMDGTSETYCIILHMQETAGNEYQNLSVGDGFSVQLLATQLASEADSFGNDYDMDSIHDALPAAGAAQVVAGQTTPYTVNIKAADDLSGNINVKAAVATVPAAAVAAGAKEVAFVIEKTTVSSNITIETDEVAAAYEITATGLDENNTTPVTFELYVGKNKEVVNVYHYDQPMADDEWTYIASTGYVIFETTSFSPFTVIFSTEPAEKPEAKPENLPEATITNVTADYPAGYDYNWNGLGINEKLNVVYKFESPETDDGSFDDWYCDFYVSVDRNLAEGQIILGGNYEGFGWVGFTNPEIAANTEVALLASAVSNELITRAEGANKTWTYDAIKSLVSTFLCGVGANSEATANLSGMNFTVSLSLTNPENIAEYYDVATITYTFP